MPESVIQGQASSFFDGGRPGGEARRVESVRRTRFVLEFRGWVRYTVVGGIAAAAAWLVLLIGAGDLLVRASVTTQTNATSEVLCASNGTDGADTGSERAALRASGSGSLPI